jgi:alpha-methylacyl-CoA racemase
MILGGALPCYNVYTTADGGRMALGALEAKFWHLFCADVDRPGWIKRQRDPDLRPEVAALFASRSLAAWSDLATRVDCCLEPVISVSAAVAGRVSVHPLVFDGERGAQEGSVPERGAHTAKLLTEAGLTEQEILTLIDEAGE